MDAWPAPASLVLWEDADLLIIDKPSGLPTLPDGYHPEAPYVRSLLEPVYGRLWIVHRLDKETSGVLALARNAAAHRSLNTQFEQHTVHKVYHALVNGVPAWDAYTQRQPLRADGDRRHRTVVDPQRGKPAVTHLQVLERFSSWTLVAARPETGRTHQVRAHLAALELPLAGDTLYGGKDNRFPPEAGMERTALHACQLTLLHPVTAQPLDFEAHYPTDWSTALDWLRNMLSGFS